MYCNRVLRTSIWIPILDGPAFLTTNQRPSWDLPKSQSANAFKSQATSRTNLSTNNQHNLKMPRHQGANTPVHADNHGRLINHNVDAMWNSTGLYLWNQVMAESGMQFQNIGWEDLEGGNSSFILKEFVDSCKARPPIQQRSNEPYDSATVVKAFNAGVHRLKQKFEHQIRANPGDYFPEELLGQCRKLLKNDRSRNMMEGEDDWDILEGIYPLPRKHSKATLLSPIHHFPDTQQRNLYNQHDLFLYARNSLANRNSKASWK